jgi:deazaflavin-dependent oxidoreductase (nitroreductase family)
MTLRAEARPSSTHLHPIVIASSSGDRRARPTLDTMGPVTSPNRLQRTIQHVASLRPVAAVFRHTFHHVDRWAVRLLRGRTLSGLLAGVPNIMLTTTGARTGRSRTVPLIGLPVTGRGTAIVGTRWGSERNPGWFHNLTSDPRAVVERGDERIDVVARRVVAGGEYDAIMRQAGAVYVGYPKYHRRISRRAVPVFVLEPVSEESRRRA